MRELRPHLKPETFVARVQRQMEQGYRLAALADHDVVSAVAGFRCGDNLAWGRHMYVDDLVMREAVHSHGYGG